MFLNYSLNYHQSSRIAETDVARAVIVWTTEETIEETTDVMVVTDVVVVVAVENDAKGSLKI
jgi:hypothetical protein